MKRSYFYCMLVAQRQGNMNTSMLYSTSWDSHSSQPCHTGIHISWPTPNIRHVGLARIHHVLTVTETMGQREAPSPPAPSSLMLETTRGKMPAGSVTQSFYKITQTNGTRFPRILVVETSLCLWFTQTWEGGEIFMWAYPKSLKGNANGLQDMHFSVCPCCITVNLELNLMMRK